MNEKVNNSKSPRWSKFGILLGIGTAIWLYAILTESNLLPHGSDAPTWKLQSVESFGKFLSLDELKGKVTVLAFWGSGCAPCLQEMDELEAVWKDLKNQGVVVVGTAAWGENSAEAMSVKSRKKVTYPFVLGTSEMINAYKVATLPVLYIIDAEGQIASSHQGFTDRKTLKRAVQKALSDQKD